MPLPAITLAQANRYLMKRQHLLTRCGDPVQVVRDACSLQAQIPSAPALSLRARVKGFRLQDYDRLIAQERRLVRTWGMRGTVHLLPADSIPLYTRVYGRSGAQAEGARLALELLAAGARTRGQLTAEAIRRFSLSESQAAELFGPWGGVLRELAMAGLLVHLPSEGADVPFARTEDWLGAQPDPPSVAWLEEELFRQYFKGYGPATLQDFAAFTSFRLSRVRAIHARVAGLAEVQLEGSKLTHLIFQEELPGLLATTGQERVPIALLPRFDTILLAYGNRERVIAPQYRKRVFRPAAVVEATVLIRGRVAGTWRYQLTARELRVQFYPFGKQPVERVEAEARRLAEWFGRERLSFSVGDAE